MGKNKLLATTACHYCYG